MSIAANNVKYTPINPINNDSKTKKMGNSVLDIKGSNPSESSFGNSKLDARRSNTGDIGGAAQVLPQGVDALLREKNVGSHARKLVSDIVGEIKSKISTGNVEEVDKLLTQAAIALNGDPDVDGNSEEILQIKAALRRSIMGLVPPRSTVAANGDLATSREANLLPGGVLGGYHAGTNTVLLSRDHVVNDDEAGVKNTVKQEVSEGIVAGIELETGRKFAGDAGDRLSSVLSGKDAKQAIEGEAPGKVDVSARLDGRDVEVVAASAFELIFKHDKTTAILPPSKLGSYDRVSFGVTVPEKGKEDHAKVAAEVTTQVANWIEGRIAMGNANGGPKLNSGAEAFGTDENKLVGSVTDFSPNNKVQNLLKNVYNTIYTLSSVTEGPVAGDIEFRLELTTDDDQLKIGNIRTNTYITRRIDKYDSEIDNIKTVRITALLSKNFE